MVIQTGVPGLYQSKDDDELDKSDSNDSIKSIINAHAKNVLKTDLHFEYVEKILLLFSLKTKEEVDKGYLSLLKEVVALDESTDVVLTLDFLLKFAKEHIEIDD